MGQGGMGSVIDDWDSLRVPLEAACETPTDKDAVRRAVDAAELVASTAGEPPDELPGDAREWVETHGVPPDDLVELACRSMKKVANENEWWREQLHDLRYRLRGGAAPARLCGPGSATSPRRSGLKPRRR